MHIDAIDIYRVSMPLVAPFRTACGDDTVTETVIVRLASAGLSGWGESTSGKDPTYAPECAASQFVISRDFIAPALLGADIGAGAELQGRLAFIRGNQFAKAAFDLAWWDLAAKTAGKPLWDMLGGRRKAVEAGADIGVLDTVDELIAAVGEAVGAGYRRVKLKCRPGWDLPVVRAVRNAFPHLTIHIDGNSAYSLDDTGMFARMDDLNLAMIEQPLAHDDLIDHAELQRRIATPICLDESVTSPAKARNAALIGACRWVNIKPGRVGGITPALEIHDICQSHGIGCWIGGMLESSIGALHCLALATLPNILYPSDIFPTARFYARDLGTPAMTHSAPGTFAVPSAPGAGAEPDGEMLAQWTMESASFTV